MAQPAADYGDVASEYRFVFDLSPSPLILVDPGGIVSLTNGEFDLLFGYPNGALIGQPVEALVPQPQRARHPDLRAGFVGQPSQRRMGMGRDLYGLHADGREMPVEIGLKPVHIAGEVWTIAAIIDLTARKTYEERLDAQRRQAEAASSELRNFAYAVSHDLKTPINTLELLLSELAEELGADLEDDPGALLDLSRQTVVRMRGQIDSLLDYTRVIGDTRAPEMIDLSEVLERVLDDFSDKIDASGATLTIGAMPTFLAHRLHMTLLFRHLIDNALKFARPGVAPEISVTASTQRGRLLIEVGDNGIGIPEDHHERVFGIFKRLHTRDEIDGAGLGLTLCRRIARELGGDVTATSLPGEGATFLIELPERLT